MVVVMENNEKTTGPGPEPIAAERKQLKARGHRLKARLAVGRGGLTDGFVQQVNQVFETTDLLKVHLDADDAAESKQMASELAERVGCYLIQRVGRVALLYRKLEKKQP